MKRRNKRTPMLTRKRSALKHLAVALIIMILMNHFMLIGLLLPRQAYHKLEERAGVGWTRVVSRDWEPELYLTHISYLSGSEDATVFGSVNLTMYGWFPQFVTALDCTKDAPLYSGYNLMYRDDEKVWYFFGRVDDPDIETVAVSLCKEEYDSMSHAYVGEEVRRLTQEELLEKDGRRYFMLKDTFWQEENRTRYCPVVIGYDGAGNEVTRMEIEDGRHISYG